MSLAWTQKVKCEMKESSLYEQFTIYFFNMFVAREGREWTVVHPNSTPIDAYQSKVERESGLWYIPTVQPSMPITDSRKYSRDHSV